MVEESSPFQYDRLDKVVHLERLILRLLQVISEATRTLSSRAVDKSESDLKLVQFKDLADEFFNSVGQIKALFRHVIRELLNAGIQLNRASSTSVIKNPKSLCNSHYNSLMGQDGQFQGNFLPSGLSLSGLWQDKELLQQILSHIKLRKSDKVQSCDHLVTL